MKYIVKFIHYVEASSYEEAEQKASESIPSFSETECVNEANDTKHIVMTDMDYEGLYKDLINQSKVIGSSGKGWGKFAGTNRKAATAITDLLARAEAAEKRAEKAERERDEAVNLLKRVNDETGNCYGCKYFDIERAVCIEKSKKSVCDCGKNNLWEWIGLKEE